ncbi:MAG: sigma-70 family RNA polymerase sigma factor [Bryobacteraceae bacterium]|nr:sigma-70 family RNA polymerase sigma factor [Bryobacteraceae bacterium]
MSESVAPVTELLRLANQGDASAEAQLMEALYSEMRKIAVAQMRNERGDHTLQPTALVNETYLRLFRQDAHEWEGKAHFLAVAAKVMRNVLVDYARARKSAKRAGNVIRCEFDENLPLADNRWEDQLLEVDQALARLAVIDPRQARVIEMRFFSGMTEGEIAALEGVSERTVKRDSRSGVAWLKAELTQPHKAARKSART